MKRIRVTRHIAAPPEAVFDVILDVDRYPEWNPFTPRTTARTDEMAVGKEFDLDCWMRAGVGSGAVSLLHGDFAHSGAARDQELPVAEMRAFSGRWH
jgi:uncharacterized protein YndB with AHSA1/START domain